MQEGLQNGKWSEWISNEGNRDKYYPLGYKGEEDQVRCEVCFRGGSEKKSACIEDWDWSDTDDGRSIAKYRFWIPDTETPTEPKTEKYSYVNIWTDKDEEALKELLAKKGRVEFENKAKLAGLMIKINHQSFYVESYKVDTMIEHADELIDALQPYRKQK
jgi:hypothetical protein